MPKACDHNVLRVRVRQPNLKMLQRAKCFKLVRTRHTGSLENNISEVTARLIDTTRALLEDRRECDRKEAQLQELILMHEALKDLYAYVRLNACTMALH